MALNAAAPSNSLDPAKPFEGLNFQQDAYCWARLDGLKSVDAYMHAYKIEDKNSRYDVSVAAAQIARNPKVVQRLKELIKERDAQTSLVPRLNREFVVNGVMELAMHAKSDSVKLRAFELLGKSAGIDLFRDVKVTEKLDRDPETIDQMIKDKLLNMVRGDAIDGVIMDDSTAKTLTIDSEPNRKDRRRRPKK